MGGAEGLRVIKDGRGGQHRAAADTDASVSPQCQHKPLMVAQTHGASTNPWCCPKPPSAPNPPSQHAPGLCARQPALVLVARVPVPALLFVVAVTPVGG